MKNKTTLLYLVSLLSFSSIAQHHEQTYYPPTDTLVLEKLNTWQDYKFGLLMHWGAYSQWGVVESWSICPEDEDWCTRRGPYASSYFEYVKAYENLQTTFNPTQFDPNLWAKAAKNAGMKYMVFTTKHHDGFCMFDSKLTNYSVANQRCPNSQSTHPDLTRNIFEAFRKEGIWTGAYFSKPDWQHPDYWDPKFPPYDRNPNYDLTKKQAKWESFVQFTHGQIMELMQNYGPIDILWLDGGWVQPYTPTSPKWGYKPVDQNIRMDELAAKARKAQPGLIVVDRAVEGPNQNYLTPEQSIPDKPLPYPWETCMTIANSWSYIPNDTYKSTATLLKNLCLIVSRGGNFLLNIAPDAQGRWDTTAYQRLEEIGAWMKINGAAIYGSKPVAPYEIKQGDTGSWVFTQVEKSVYAIWIPGEQSSKNIKLDATIFQPKKAKPLNPSNSCTLKKGMLTIKLAAETNHDPQVFQLY
ncbi:MAG: alpha-L-fucosidase [Flavobacteriales bacterium]